MNGNVITANFRGGRTTMTAPLWQYDYGQVLRFTGVSLPETYEVHFSNAKRRGDAKTAIGDANGVVIPDEFLATGDNVYAWIFLHATQEDGETEYMATIPVNKRATPSDEAPTPQEQSAITQAIAALNSAVVDVQEAVEAADSARASATSAGASATAAAASEAGVAEDADRASAAATAAESAQGAAEAAQAGAETAQTGAESARDEAAQASAAQIAQINATGVAVLESIPADYTELSEDVGNLKSEITDFYIVGKNLLDKNSSNKRTQYYCAYDTGTIIYSSAETCVAVPVTGGKKISINQRYIHVVFSSDASLYLPNIASGSVISGYINGTTQSSIIEGLSIPDNAVYAVISFATSQADSLQVEYGTECTEYVPYGKWVDGSKILMDSIPADRIKAGSTLSYVYKLKADGTGDFATLRECVEAINTLDSYDDITIKLDSGTYDIRAMYTNEEWNETGFIGLKIPKNVSLVGTGKTRDAVLITCTSDINSDKISTLNFTDNITIENLTVYGNNVRYTIHDDYSDYYFANDKGNYRKIKNVDFVGENLIYKCIYGAGTQGGADWTFDNCRFIQKTESNYAFSVHDRYTTSQTFSLLPETYHFKNCEFIGVGGVGIRLSPAVGKVEETVIIDHCILTSIDVSSQYTGGDNSTTVFNILGSGNSKEIAMTYYNNHDKLSFPKFADVTNAGINMSGAAFAIGDYCKVDTNGGLIAGTQAEHDGIVLNAAAINDLTYYK